MKRTWLAAALVGTVVIGCASTKDDGSGDETETASASEALQSDSGSEGGSDGATESGTDSGSDSGTDAGTDSGTRDSGTDAGICKASGQTCSLNGTIHCCPGLTCKYAGNVGLLFGAVYVCH